MKIQVKSTDVETLRGTGRNGRPYEIRKQTALLLIDDEVRKLEIPLGRDQSPYALGFYEVDPRSFEVDRFNNLAIGRLVLSPLRAAGLKTA